MIRIVVLLLLVTLLAAPVDAQDARYYSLINRLNKVDSDLAELKRLKQRVSQLEVMNNQQKRKIQGESRRIDQLSQRNRSLMAFVNSVCAQAVNPIHEDGCGNMHAAQGTNE